MIKFDFDYENKNFSTNLNIDDIEIIKKVFDDNNVVNFCYSDLNYQNSYNFAMFKEKLKQSYEKESINHTYPKIFDFKLVILMNTDVFHNIFSQNNYSTISKMKNLIIKQDFIPEDIALNFVCNDYDTDFGGLNNLIFVFSTIKQHNKF